MSSDGGKGAGAGVGAGVGAAIVSVWSQIVAGQEHDLVTVLTPSIVALVSCQSTECSIPKNLHASLQDDQVSIGPNPGTSPQLELDGGKGGTVLGALASDSVLLRKATTQIRRFVFIM